MNNTASKDGIVTYDELMIGIGKIGKLSKDGYKLTIGKSDIIVNSSYNSHRKSFTVNTSIENHYIAYIYYLPEWENEMINDRSALAKYYGVSEDDIGTASISDSFELSESWNSMRKTRNGKNISTVVINTHANAKSIIFGDSEASYFTLSSFNRLQNKNIDNLILYGCNSGHYDHVGDNIASYFTSKVNGGKVLASDGTVYSDKIIYGYTGYSSRNTSSFRDQRKKGSKRGNLGWIIYQKEAGQTKTTILHQTCMTLKSMINTMK